MSVTTQHRGNRIIAALSNEEQQRLTPHLESISLKQSEVLFRPDEQLQYVYFPVNSVVSLLTDLEDGTGMEVGLVGREGVVGVSTFLGGSETKVATVQGEGAALRLRTGVLQEEFRKGGALQRVLLRYTHALMAQISQSVVCNIRHKAEGRMGRWLLMYHDRIEKDEFELTHEFMSHMIGVRRATVSEIAQTLQEMNFIRYQRGRITILDRKGLEEFVCECYPAVREKFDEFQW
ncbi:MAG TPA: Crp/Fnr family transcriptional regulator [Pyrinomonadaceae bacterium]|jgi:CRP-like cAMP-binding protein